MCPALPRDGRRDVKSLVTSELHVLRLHSEESGLMALNIWRV